MPKKTKEQINNQTKVGFFNVDKEMRWYCEAMPKEKKVKPETYGVYSKLETKR